MKLSVDNLNKLHIEYPSIFNDMFEEGHRTVKNAWKVNLKSLGKCEAEINRR